MAYNSRPVTGSLKERNGKYTAVINAYDEYGKRKQKYHSLNIPVKGNKRKAEAELQKILLDYESNACYTGAEDKIGRTKKNDPLFADFLKEWLEITAPTIERTTYMSYKSQINARLDSFFRSRKLRLSQVEARHIRELHQSIFKDGCNANTVVRYHAIVRKALQFAVRNDIIATNVADKVDRPKVNKYIASFYSKDELNKLFNATKDEPISLVIQLAAYYGLRRSEVLGIRWGSIDFVRGTLSINHKVTQGVENGETILYTEDKLKTKSSFRTLPLIPCIRELLFEAKEKQAEYRALFKKSYCKDYEDYVCVDQMGKLFRPDYITDRFTALLAQNGLRKVRFHDLRHSCASLLLAQGVAMKQIQDWLGHSTFNTTADIYSHLDFSSKEQSAQAIAAALGSAVSVVDDDELEQEEAEEMTMKMEGF